MKRICLQRGLALGCGLVLAGAVVASHAGPTHAAPQATSSARDPMQAPADARPAPAPAASAAAAAPAAARHLMVIDGRRYVVSGGRKRGIGDLLGDARIERIEDNAVLVRQDGVQQRLPLYGAVQTRPAAESLPPAVRPPALAAPTAPPTGSALQRPPRPPETSTLSLARPERPVRPDFRPDFNHRAGDPQ